MPRFADYPVLKVAEVVSVAAICQLFVGNSASKPQPPLAARYTVLACRVSSIRCEAFVWTSSKVYVDVGHMRYEEGECE